MTTIWKDLEKHGLIVIGKPLTWEEYRETLLAKEAKSTQMRGGNMGDTREQEAGGAVTRETKMTAKLASGKEITCPECGIPNPVSRMTCEICHKPLRKATERKGGKVMDEMAKELYGMNKKLKQAMEIGEPKVIAKIKAQIKQAVTKSDGVFKVGENGLATQAKSTATKTPKAPKVPKKIRKCPCCDGETASYFAMGHDGRVHGILIKIGLGKMKLNEAPKGVQAMYPIWNKDKSQSMKSIAQKMDK